MNRLLLTLLFVVAWPSAAAAFCGFYVGGGDAKLFNDATQVVLLRHENRTALSMQNNYTGPPQKFAMVVPVPQVLQEEDVKTLPKDVFDRIDKLSAPRLVEYWEQDPCNPYANLPGGVKRRMKGGARPASAALLEKDGLVTVEAEFEVGEYQIVILSAKESTALETWLKAEKYNIPAGAEPYFRPYVESGMYFFVAKVDPQKVKFENGQAILSPLRFSYESEKFQLPIRLGMINSNGTQDLIAYVIAKNQRYEVANYPNIFIPTNLEVSPDTKESFGDFYRTLYDRVTEEHPGAVVTEYSWSTSSCDPCPGPALSAADLLTLGSDVVGGEGPVQKGAKRRRMPSPMGGAVAFGWTLTRLHARYEPDQIGEDLVFAAAESVQGGNERRGPDGALSTTAEPSGTNTFQGRYIIRHEWGGAVDCEEPKRGIWGGKPTVSTNPSPNTEKPKGAAKKIDLTKMLKTALPGIDVKPASAQTPPEPAPAAGEGTADTTPAPTKSEKPSSCATASSGPASVLSVLLFALAMMGLRRRHCSTRKTKTTG